MIKYIDDGLVTTIYCVNKAIMKQIFLILFLPIFISAQEISLIEEGKSWNMEEYPFIDSGNIDLPVTYVGYAFEIDGDTMLNNTQYKKVYFKDNWSYTIFPDEEDIEGANLNNVPELIGAIREDTNSDRIYYISWDTKRCFMSEIPLNEEILLYDFGIEIGDTVNYSFPVDYQYVLENKSSYILANGDSSTLYQFQQDIQWVRAIGGINLNYGILGPLQTIPFEGGCYLSCVHIDSLYYLGSEDSNCDINYDLLVNTKELKSKKEEPKAIIFPIPANENLNIIIENASAYSYQIYDLHGKPIGVEKKSNRKLSMEDISSYRNGLYIIKIKLQNGKIICSKIIKK